MSTCWSKTPMRMTFTACLPEGQSPLTQLRLTRVQILPIFTQVQMGRGTARKAGGGGARCYLNPSTTAFRQAQDGGPPPRLCCAKTGRIWTRPALRWRMRIDTNHADGRAGALGPGTTGLALRQSLRTADEVTHQLTKLGPVVRSGGGAGSRSCHQPAGIPEVPRLPEGNRSSHPCVAVTFPKAPAVMRERGDTRFRPAPVADQVTDMVLFVK